MKLQAWGLTDVGRKREHNEDSCLLNLDLHLFAVADGMGGHAGGDHASRLAVEVLEGEIKQLPANPCELPTDKGALLDSPPAQALRTAAKKAGQIIYDIGVGSPQLAGMGTTLTALLFCRDHIFLAHVGDSRAYIYRKGHVQQLTEDHSWIEEQVKAGFMTADEARGSALKHVITRSVGFERDVEVDVLAMQILEEDCYLICSDGLSNYIPAEEMENILANHSYADVPKIFIDAANERGGDDNITAILIHVKKEAEDTSLDSTTMPLDK